jgi:hypothetical protein
MARTKRRASTAKRHTKKSNSRVVVVAKTHRKRRSRVSGTGVGKTKARRRRSSVGKTAINSSNLKQIGMAAIGIAGGVLFDHAVIKPAEKWILQKYPQAGKMLPYAEIAVGGFIAIKAKNPLLKAGGLGILAGGVMGAMRQAKFMGISGGSDDYSVVKIPIAGELQSMVSGLLEDNRRMVRTSVISGMENTNVMAGSSMPMPNTNVIAGEEMAGIWDDVYEFPRAKGI